MPVVSRDGISLNITYHVVAYDESYGGYGEDASRDFDNAESAIEYARKLRANLHPNGPRFEPIRVSKMITMTPICLDIQF